MGQTSEAEIALAGDREAAERGHKASRTSHVPNPRSFPRELTPHLVQRERVDQGAHVLVDHVALAVPAGSTAVSSSSAGSTLDGAGRHKCEACFWPTPGQSKAMTHSLVVEVGEHDLGHRLLAQRLIAAQLAQDGLACSCFCSPRGASNVRPDLSLQL